MLNSGGNIAQQNSAQRDRTLAGMHWRTQKVCNTGRADLAQNGCIHSNPDLLQEANVPMQITKQRPGGGEGSHIRHQNSAIRGAGLGGFANSTRGEAHM
jgi:hypothetical protein